MRNLSFRIHSKFFQFVVPGLDPVAFASEELGPLSVATGHLFLILHFRCLACISPSLMPEAPGDS